MTDQTQFDVLNINNFEMYKFKVSMKTDCGLVPITEPLGVKFGPPEMPPSTNLKQLQSSAYFGWERPEGTILGY